MKNKSYAIILFVSITSITTGCGIKMPQDSEAFYRVTSPDQRVNDQGRYFKDEYGKISEKRKNVGIYSGTGIKPTKLVGLGISGGGIRSSAYQLGFLAGLQQAKLSNEESANKEITILDRTDYLSCVSGGCWATGAFLIASEPTETFFDCLTEQATKKNVNDMTKCNRAKRILRNEQNLELIGKDDKEEWEDEIKKAYFPEGCENFEFAERNSKCRKNLKNKPNVIFNSTHSTLAPSRYGGNLGNLPFQITPDQVGTIADCGSNNLENKECGGIKGNLAGKGKVGFFVRQDAQDFEWLRRERSGSTLWLSLTSDPGSQMSKTMAHSSAALGSPTYLSFSMGLTYQGEFPSEEIRDNYFLTDGGFVENLGLLSLVERGVDLIVLSDMGYPERVGDDLQLAIDQVHKLLKCDVTGKEDMKAANLITTLRYSCPNAPENKGTKEGLILYVRPYPENIKDFKDQLKTEQPKLYACIEEKTHKCYGEKPKPFKTPDKDAELEKEYRFPLTETMLVRYDERLIRSYYLLGKFIGEKLVGPKIDKALLK